MSNKKLYRVWWRLPEEDYQAKRWYIKKVMTKGVDPRLYLSSDKTRTLLEEELKTYWDFGGGVEKLEYAGELDESYFRPRISEPDFVDMKIKSKVDDNLLGFQN